jgi:hypothetical protein
MHYGSGLWRKGNQYFLPMTIFWSNRYFWVIVRIVETS